MALPLPPTLEEARASVIIRCAVGAVGAISKTAIPLFDECINQANSRIYQQAPWSRYSRVEDIPTQNVSPDYDIPDGANGPGGMMQIEIINLSGRPTPVPYQSERRLYANTTQYVNTPGTPNAWWYINDLIRFDRIINSTAWPTMRFTYQLAPTRLVNLGDRAAVDREALVQLATIYSKSALSLDFDRTLAMREFEDYLRGTRSNTSEPGEMFSIASQRADGPAYWNTRGAPWSVDWNPGGWW